jgi:glycerophosphoryl diester phosphodiesterase
MSADRGPHPYLDCTVPIGFAHRGGALEQPENTWAAFFHARALGYRYVETDVHATADGEVVVFHDSTLDRLTDRTGAVGSLTHAQLSTARVAGSHEIPRLVEVMAEFGEMRWNIDAKSDAVVEPLIATLRSNGALERACIATFSAARMARLRALGGDALCTALVPPEIVRLKLAALVGRHISTAGRCVQVPMRWRRGAVITESFVTAAHRSGVSVHAWTIDDRREMESLLDIGVDGIMTDRPSLLRDVYESRGIWPSV